MTRAVTINAPLDEVWAWLAQIGQDRGGFYSYEWLENLAGCRMRNADRIHPDWQRRAIGDTVLLHPSTGLKVARFEPPRSYAFEGGWYFALEQVNETTTRLLARSRMPRGLASLAYAGFIELPHFIMERKMPDPLYRAVFSLFAKTMRAKRGLLEDGTLSLASETRLPRASFLPIRPTLLVSLGGPHRTADSAHRTRVPNNAR
jgi:hypothetical protein